MAPISQRYPQELEDRAGHVNPSWPHSDGLNWPRRRSLVVSSRGDSAVAEYNA